MVRASVYVKWKPFFVFFFSFFDYTEWSECVCYSFSLCFDTARVRSDGPVILFVVRKRVENRHRYGNIIVAEHFLGLQLLNSMVILFICNL